MDRGRRNYTPDEIIAKLREIEVLRIIPKGWRGAAMVVDENGKPCGIMMDDDIRRAVDTAENANIRPPVKY